MSYTDFTLETVTDVLGLDAGPAELFPGLEPSPVPPWLVDMLERGTNQVLVSEKSRSEFIVVPILFACQEAGPGPITIYSGQRMDVDPGRGLVGECDFILSATRPIPALRAPLLTIVEAKKHDIEGGIWQCIAQMEGARVFNERAGRTMDVIFGCVTNGEAWQFLRLADRVAEIDRRRFYIDNVGGILAAFATILTRSVPARVAGTVKARGGP